MKCKYRISHFADLKKWISPAGTVEPNVRFTLTKEERKEMDEELMNNQTSNLITEENGDFCFFFKKQETATLSAASHFLHLQGTFPFCAKKRENPETTKYQQTK